MISFHIILPFSVLFKHNQMSCVFNWQFSPGDTECIQGWTNKEVMHMINYQLQNNVTTLLLIS